LLSGRRLIAAAVCVALVAGGVVVWLLARGSDDDSASPPTVAAPDSISRPSPPTTSSETPSADGNAAPKPDRSHFKPLPKIEPARLIADPPPVTSADVIDPIVNGWRAGDHKGITLVEAGLAGDDRSGTKGRFVVFRERERPFAQNIDLVDVRGSGALRITRAPAGAGASSTAQREGELHFTSARGVTGTLHLSSDTVTIDARAADPG
jgi:hypothetical protein